MLFSACWLDETPGFAVAGILPEFFEDSSLPGRQGLPFTLPDWLLFISLSAAWSALPPARQNVRVGLVRRSGPGRS